MANQLISGYYNQERIRKAVERGEHRNLVGGLWDEIGELTIQFLIEHGLQPEHSVLDVGCGCLRVGVHLARYLDPGRYFGTDINNDLLDAGYSIELTQQGLQAKVPRDHLLCDGAFELDRLPTSEPFDVVLAQSVFTHLPANHIRLCLHNLVSVTRPGTTFYATVFLCPDDIDWTQPLLHQPGGKTSHAAQDPYHYTFDDVRSFTRGLPWNLDSISDWNHPRNQMMATFVRSG